MNNGTDDSVRTIAVYGLITGLAIIEHNNDNESYLSKEVYFDDEISICPTPEDIASKILPMCEPYISEETRKKIGRCFFAVKIKLNTNIADEITNIHKTIERIRRLISVFRIVKPVLAHPKYFLTEYPANDVIEKEYFINRISHLNNCFSAKMNEDNGMTMRKFDLKLLETKVRPLWGNIDLVIKNNGRTWRSWQFYNGSYYQHYNEIRILHLAIALESLFSTADAELTYSLALRTSRFLSGNYKGRKKLFNQIKYAYKVRSWIVHGMRENSQNCNFSKGKKSLQRAEITFRDCVQNSLYKIISEQKYLNIFDSRTTDYPVFLNRLVLNNTDLLNGENHHDST